MNWYLPTKTIFGSGKLSELSTLDLVSHSDKSVIFCDEFISKTAVIENVKNAFTKNVEIFPCEPHPPTIDDIVRSINLFSSQKINLVMAIGGGSTIDHAKAVCAYYSSTNIVNSIRKGKKILSRNIKLIAIPTTSGTGSEVTPYATIWDIEEQKKRSVAGSAIFPEIAVVDPVLTLSLPKNQTSSTGLDAFSHAVEAYWAKNDNEISDCFALTSIKILYNNLINTVNDGKNIKNREAVMKASLFSGMAFSQTRTAAAHAISYPLTLKLGLPHGWACSLTLPELLKFNVDSLIKRNKLNELLNIFNVNTVDDLSKKWKQFYIEAGGQTLKSLNVSDENIEWIASESYTPGRMENNPAELSKQSIIKILKNS